VPRDTPNDLAIAATDIRALSRSRESNRRSVVSIKVPIIIDDMINYKVFLSNLLAIN
jgi:hypothetical protein